MTSGELARIIGHPESTVRMWVRRGLIVPDARTAGGHSRFSAETARRVADQLRAAS